MTCQYTVTFDSGADPARAPVGDKCAALLEMTGSGVPVPPGFAVTFDAFDALLDRGGLRAEIDAVLGGLDAADAAGTADTAGTETRAAAARRLVTGRPVPSPVAAAITAAYHSLGNAGDSPGNAGDVSVAVRSSAEAEDLPGMSFAGQYDTYLGVRGADAVVDAVRRCWASLWTGRAIMYRSAGGLPERGLRMAVGVQRMVDARTAGAALTMNPADGDRSKIVIDAGWGLGGPVVSGEITPDNYVVDKVLLVAVRTTVSPKPFELVPAPDGRGLVRRAVEDARRLVACLTPAEVIAVARLAKTVESHYGCPQDIEWAIAPAPAPDGGPSAPAPAGGGPHNPAADGGPPAPAADGGPPAPAADGGPPAPAADGGPQVLLLQTRPETVWSRGPRTTAEVVPGAGVASIADTMLGLGPLPT
jgi:pyruvate, water dikinase